MLRTKKSKIFGTAVLVGVDLVMDYLVVDYGYMYN